ncbi:hypothetical protein I79_017869 [Cricetulus griseus]|uniref:Uncharacterized protein n=1 Tax=Cricetulus griseus TaxID=10029 RepID=G3I368_CRIGR|nr:hypothetical protein I79_017869 [Cricetulus griseus]
MRLPGRYWEDQLRGALSQYKILKCGGVMLGMDAVQHSLPAGSIGTSSGNSVRVVMATSINCGRKLAFPLAD